MVVGYLARRESLRHSLKSHGQKRPQAISSLQAIHKNIAHLVGRCCWFDNPSSCIGADNLSRISKTSHICA